jgi:alpha-glucosidase
VIRDNPPNPDFREGEPPHLRLLPLYSADRPEVHDVIRGLRAVIDEFPERVLIGEIYLPIERLVTYYGRELCGAHLPLNFSLLEAPWRAQTIAQLVDRYESALPPGGWPNLLLGNHDRPRLATRVGPEQARVAAMLRLTLRGTPTLYYGDEIGMRQVPMAPEVVRDPFEKNVPGLGLGRDGCRTPMQLDASAFAGFSTVAPWLPLAGDFSGSHVAGERADPTSHFNLCRRLIALRRARPALTRGAYRPIAATGDVLAFVREVAGDWVLVALNFGSKPSAVTLPGGAGTILLSSGGGRDGEILGDSFTVRGHAGAVIALDP